MDTGRRQGADGAEPDGESLVAGRALRDFAGPDHLIFGSDHPWVSVNSLITLVEEMSIAEADKAKIFGLNAQGLFGIG